MSEYEDIPEIVNFLMNDGGFTEGQIIKLVQDIRKKINLFSFELIKTTVRPHFKS